MKKIIFTMVLSILMLANTAAYAGLIGDFVIVEHKDPNLGFSALINFFTISPTSTFHYLTYYNATFDDSHIYVDFLDSGTWASGSGTDPFNGFYISQLDTDVSNITIDTSITGWTPTGRLIQGTTYLGFDWQNLSFTGNSYFNVTLNFDDDGGSTVPEPATMALFGIGLLGAGTIRRRRRDGNR